MARVNSASGLIAALDGNKTTGMCRCPAHDDKTPSLHVTEKSGRVLFKCHAGCSQASVIDALKSRTLWPNNSDALSRISDTEEIDQEYEQHRRFRRGYAILRAAARSDIGPPTAYLKGRGIRLTPDSAMMLTASDARRLTNRPFPAVVLPVINRKGFCGVHVISLTKAGTAKLSVDAPKKTYGPVRGGYVPLGSVDPDKPLLVAEGVESALSAMCITELPAVATIGTSGMAQVELPECSEVIICADNDRPGMNAANALASRLIASGRVVRIATPEQNANDWNDALCAGTDVTVLRAKILQSKIVKPPREVLGVSVKDFMRLQFPQRQHLLRPWLPSGGLVMLHAQRGAGKTFFILSVARAVANGAPFLNWECEHRKRVLYIDGELPGSLLQKRLALLGDQPDNMFVLSREQFYLRRKLMPDVGTDDGREALDRIIDRQRPDLIILNSLSTLVRSGVENEAESWAPIQDWLMQHRWQGRTIVLIHHEGRSNKPRGTSKREDVLDTMIGLRRREPKLGEQWQKDTSMFDLEFTKKRDFYGADAAPAVLHLSTASGVATWRRESAQENRRDSVAKLLIAGWKQRDIAKEVGLSEGRIAQIKREMRPNI